jgi:transcriptional regulator with XRE-family HTH domain
VKRRRSALSYNNDLADPIIEPRDAEAVRREVGRRISQRMYDKGWNQSELARQASLFLPEPIKGQKQGLMIGRDMISNVCRGQHLPRPPQMRAIARALGCAYSDLMPIKGIPSVANAPEFAVESLGTGRVRVRMDKEISYEDFKSKTLAELMVA